MGDQLKWIGLVIARYGLVIVLLWIGGMKFTAYEAEGIKPLVANSQLMSWAFGIMSVTAFSAGLGVIEIALGVLIALRPLWPMGSALGSVLAVGMFLTTISFLFTTPGWEPSLGGFPALSAMPGQFLLKDIVLLGVALLSAGEAFEAAQISRREKREIVCQRKIVKLVALLIQENFTRLHKHRIISSPNDRYFDEPTSTKHDPGVYLTAPGQRIFP